MWTEHGTISVASLQYRDRGNHNRHDRSPPLILSPLRPPPPPRPSPLIRRLRTEQTPTRIRPHTPSPTPTPPVVEMAKAETYPRIFYKPFEDTYETLYDAQNVMPLSPSALRGSVPQRVSLTVVQEGPCMPTHVLAISESTPSQSTRQASASTSTRSAVPPIPLPINVELLRNKFTHDLSHLFPGDSRSTTTQVPTPYWDERTKRMMISVPVVPFCAPHPPSMSLLLLFGMGLHTYSDHDRTEVAEESDVSDSISTSTSASTSTTSSVPSSSSASPESESESETSSTDSPYPMGKHTPIGLLATYLLPTPVIEEFPAIPCMAETMVRHCPPEDIHSYAEFNSGLWRNTLQLAPRSEDVMDIVRTAMNVSMMAKRMVGLAQVQRRTSLGGSSSGTRASSQVDPREAPRPSRQRVNDE